MSDLTCLDCEYCVLTDYEEDNGGVYVEGYCLLKEDTEESYEDFDFEICEYFKEVEE